MSKVQNLITYHLDTWTQAIETKSSAGRGSSNKFTLVGIKKLRELILEMAVRGLLVPQDPNDEPASILLDKILAEKAQLIKDGKIKKTKVLPDISEDEKPSGIPDNWVVARLGNIAEIERGGSPRPIKDFITDDEDGFNWIKIGDTEKGSKYIESTAEKIKKEGLFKTRRVYPGDFLLTNSMSFGRPYITKIEGCIHDGWLRIHPPKILDSNYLYLLLSSPYVFLFFQSAAAGAVVQNLNADKVRELPVLIPSINEQKRIVAKVDELMALCDQLEQQTLNSIEAHQTLVETLLNELVNPNNTANIEQAWSLISENFDVLFTTEKSIDTLKQTILQLAVMGKLVPQNPNDEPASELLKKIATEKAQLIKDKKIKKTKPLPEITEEEKPFDLPNGWEWVNIGDVTSLMSGKGFKKSEYTDSGARLFQIANVSLGETKWEVENFLPLEYLKTYHELELFSGDVLIALNRPLLNKKMKVCILSESDLPAILYQRVGKFSFYGKTVYTRYFYYFMQSPLFIENLFVNLQGSDQPFINLSQLVKFLFPIPPLEEQTRIVAKVNELITLCDQLKTQLQTAQQTQTHLAQSIAQDVLA